MSVTKSSASNQPFFYNKLVGGAGFSLLSVANIQAGDSILVVAPITESAQILISVDNVCIDFVSTGNLISTLTSGSLLKVTGNRFRSRGLRVRADGAMGAGQVIFELGGNDGSVISGLFELNNGALALTNALKITGNRSELSASILATLGTYTSPYNDTGLSNDKRVRG